MVEAVSSCSYVLLCNGQKWIQAIRRDDGPNFTIKKGSMNSTSTADTSHQTTMYRNLCSLPEARGLCKQLLS